jgi:hypothetical protein
MDNGWVDQGELARGRAAYVQGAWRAAHAALRDAALEPADLQRLATAAYMLGRDEEYVEALERAHQGHLAVGALLPAARCAFWISINLTLRGVRGGATGWRGRAQRLVERAGGESAEQGLLLVAAMLAHESAGERDAALAAGAEAVALGERLGDSDLFALAAQDRGVLLIRSGRVSE